MVAADVIVRMDDGSVALIRRKNEPFKGYWAIPGGMVEEDETVEQAAIREMKEEAGIDIELVRLVGVYSGPHRDPRGNVVSICYLARHTGGELRAGSDASEVRLFKKMPENLAFDHRKMLTDARVFEHGE